MDIDPRRVRVMANRSKLMREEELGIEVREHEFIDPTLKINGLISPGFLKKFCLEHRSISPVFQREDQIKILALKRIDKMYGNNTTRA